MVISAETRAQIKQLEIYTRRILSSVHVGDFRTAVKGSGFEFESLREYIPGDDIRFIDWPATARSGKFLVRQYYEEKSRTIMLVVDGSASTEYGKTQSRFSRIREIAAVLAIAGSWTKDAVGLIIFNQDVVLEFPPTRSRIKIEKLIHALYEYTPRGITNFSQAFKKINTSASKNTVLFLISDFIDDEYQLPLSALTKKNDVIAVRVLDAIEKLMPPLGIIELEDPETGQRVTVDTRKNNEDLRIHFFNKWLKSIALQFQQLRVDLIDIEIDKPFVPDLIRFFRRRMMYR